MSWLNEATDSNIAYMSVTLDVSQLPIGWLNEEASKNIDTMLVTCETSQFPIGWLNAEALSNIANMFVTRDVSQFVISPLNMFFSPKPTPFGYPLISVTKLVSQFGIVPYGFPDAHSVHSPVTGASAKQSETKTCQLASGMHLVHVHEFAGPVTALVHVNFA